MTLRHVERLREERRESGGENEHLPLIHHRVALFFKMAPVLGYWNIRGLAEPVRYLLHYLQIGFEDKRYEFGPEPNYLDSDWMRNDKQNLGLELPNIPYYIDGDTKLTQSFAILRHLARKHNLYYPTVENDIARFEMMEGHARDLQMGLVFMALNPNFEQMKDGFAFVLMGHVKAASNFLGDKVWLFGEDISHVDFVLFEALECLKKCYPDCLDPHENLVKHQERFASLPGIEKYRKNSPRWPLYSPYAFWGGKGDEPQ